MSINFESALTEAQQARIRQLFSDRVVAMDEKTVLVNGNTLEQRAMKEVAKETGQVTEVKLHAQGEIKTLSDGSQYEVTAQGWRKIT